MKTLRILSLLIVAALMFSCEKDVKDEVKMGEVSFGIEHIDFSLKTDGYDWPECDDAEPVSALIKIGGNYYNPLVFYLNDKLYTQAIKLNVGQYDLEEFYLLDDVYEGNLNDLLNTFDLGDVNILKAAPKDDADYADYVNFPLTRVDYIDVPEFGKVEFTVEVLCYESGNHEQFGFFWFNITEIVVREICMFGDLCIKDYEEYEGENSPYVSAFGPDLSAYPFDLPALFRVKAYRNGDLYDTFMNFDIETNVFTTGAVCVKFPVRLDGEQEDFTFELEVLVRKGSGFAYEPFADWGPFTTSELETYLDDENDQDVWSFVVGSCNYNADIVFPPYLNIMDEANITINHDISLYNADNWPWLYWKLTVNDNYSGYDVLNQGDWAGFCGDGQKTIPSGNYDFDVYNALYYDFTSNQLPVYITEEKLNRVHWLISNLGNYGYNISGLYIDQGELSTEHAKQIQDALWIIINGENASGVPWNNTKNQPTPAGNKTVLQMANDAISNGTNFVPLPGQWSSVLLITDHPNADEGKYYQIIFVMVDP